MKNTAAISRPRTVGELERQVRDSREAVAALKRDLAEAPAKISAAAMRKDAGEVVWWEQRARDLPNEITVAEEEAARSHQAFADARGAELTEKLGRDLAQERQGEELEWQGILSALHSLGAAGAARRRRTLRIAELVTQLTGNVELGRRELHEYRCGAFLEMFVAAIARWVDVGPESDGTFQSIDSITGVQGAALREARRSFSGGTT